MTKLISDNQSFNGATTRFGNTIPCYDNGFGPLWVVMDSMGIVGIVRTTEFYEAYEIAEDEFFPEASDTLPELEKEYGEDFGNNSLFNEAYGFRPNGPNKNDTNNHGIYQKDLNGEAIDLLTSDLVQEWEIVLNITDQEE